MSHTHSSTSYSYLLLLYFVFGLSYDTTNVPWCLVPTSVALRENIKHLHLILMFSLHSIYFRCLHLHRCTFLYHGIYLHTVTNMQWSWELLLSRGVMPFCSQSLFYILGCRVAVALEYSWIPSCSCARSAIILSYFLRLKKHSQRAMDNRLSELQYNCNKQCWKLCICADHKKHLHLVVTLAISTILSGV